MPSGTPLAPHGESSSRWKNDEDKVVPSPPPRLSAGASLQSSRRKGKVWRQGTSTSSSLTTCDSTACSFCELNSFSRSKLGPGPPLQSGGPFEGGGGRVLRSEPVLPPPSYSAPACELPPPIRPSPPAALRRRALRSRLAGYALSPPTNQLPPAVPPAGEVELRTARAGGGGSPSAS